MALPAARKILAFIAAAAAASVHALGPAAAVSDDGRVYAVSSDASGTFTGWTQVHDFGAGNIRGVALDHFDRDAYPDLVSGSVSGNTITLYRFPGNAAGGFGSRVAIGSFTAPGSYLMDLATGDLNGDGYADIAANTNSTTTAFFLSNGTGGWNVRTEILDTHNGRGMDFGDMDEDGRLDMVRARYSDGQVALYRGDGAGAFTFVRFVGDAGTDPYGLAVADFNTDGHLDVLANEGGSGNPILWRGNGDGTFMPSMVPAGVDFNNYNAWDAFDYNGDGSVDLVAATYSSQAVYYVPGFGNGNFGSMVRINPASPSPGNVLGVAALPYRHPLAPVARATPAEQTVAVGSPVRLDGSASTAAPGTSLTGQTWILGDGNQAAGAVVDHTYAAKGRYWPVHRVSSGNGMTDMARVLAIVTGPPPVAHAGGPYTFTEAQALNETWTGQLDGRGSQDDGGEGASYVWNLMPDVTFSDEFNGPLDGATWIHAGSSTAGGTLRVGSTSMGDWGASRVFTQGNFTRRAGLSFYTRVLSRTTEYLMFGFKNTNTNYSYTQLQHAFYINGAGLYIYEAGNSRGHFRNLSHNTWYDFKIELLAAGATYWLRTAPEAAWELVYTSTHNSGTELKAGFSGYYQGQNEVEYVHVGRRSEGRNPTVTFPGPGTHPINLTVTDFLGQSSSAATTVTTTGEQPPVARTGGPYLFDETAALNGQWVARLDGRSSTDDFGIARYDWDFGDGTTGTGAQPVKTYAGRGPYNIRLTVRDNSGQIHSDQGVVSFSSGAAPVARITGPAFVDEAAANSGNWTAAFSGSASSDDVSIWRYEWNFGNGRTATGAAPSVQYAAMGTYTVTLTVYDHAGQSHSTTHSIQVRGNQLPVARIAGPAQVFEDAARNGLWTATFNAAASSDDFGLWRYQWAFGDGGTATTANPTHLFAGPGQFTVRLTVFDHAGQSHFADHVITLSANEPPVARIVATPTTVEGARTISFNGLTSSDDFGISDWAWDFGERMFPFDGTLLSPVEWAPSAGIIQDNRVIATGTGAWGARFVQATRNYQRESELRARVRVPAGANQMVIGFKELDETAVLADFVHGVFFNGGSWRTIENGTTQAVAGTYAANAEYEIRVVTKAAGADYYMRPIANPAWTLLRSSTATTAYPLVPAFSVLNGTWEIDDLAVRARAHGSQATGVFGATGQATLTVTDHARQTNVATQAITVVQGAPPTASIQAPDSYGAGLEVSFSGLASSDDHVIARYEWDFGDGTGAVGDRVTHSYATAGVYTVRLTVYDFAGQSGAAVKPINITGQGMVRCVPWRFNNGIEVPHETWTGKLVTLKGVASTAPRPFTYTWDFGDGSPVATGTVTTEEQAYEIEAQHAYSGPHGTPYIATLSIVDAAGNRSTDTYPLIMKDRNLTVETNVAIDEGLWYLHKSQIRTVAGGLALGIWSSYGGYRTNVTASSIQAFEINGHLPLGDPAQDPYVETVRRGMDFLFTLVSYNVIGPQTHGNPDANGNGIGIGGTEADQPYQMGAVMDAIIASGAPNHLTRTGGVNVRGRRYIDLVQDMADMYAWGQEETGFGRGGWRYSWHGGSDNSAAQWGAIGLIPAERIWGITVPNFVKTENQVWLNASYQGGTSAQCGFGYTGPGHSNELTPSGLVQLAFQRAPRTSTQWSCSEAHMDNTWTQFLSANTTYGYYAFTKAMRLTVPPVVNLSVSGRDWFDADPNGLRRTLVNRQRADGSWLSNHPYPSEAVMNTAWTTIILTPTLFENPPVALIHASPNPGAVGQPVRFDGSQSYHVDPFRRVVTYAWDFDASDGVDWTSPDAEGPNPTHAFGALRPYTVSLRVGDDQDPQNFDVATAVVNITIPPHPPTAVPGGPYIAATGETVALDGSGSFDIDASQGDAITRYGWETDFLNPRDFDDALGARPAGVTFPSAGTWNVGLRVTDNTAAAFPQAGSPNLTNDAYTTVQVHNRCLENLAVRAKTTMVALTWTHDGSARYTIRRSTVSPSYGFTDIGTTASTFSTFVDYNLENGRTYYYRVVSANNCASHAVSIVPRFRSTNRRPVFTSVPPTAAQEGQPFTFDANATDPDGHALTYLLDEGPAGMTINAATGVIAWTPTRAQVGTHTVAIRAQDPNDMAAVQAFILTVSPRPNLPPTVAVAGPTQGLSGQGLVFDGSGSTDPEGDTPLGYAWNFGDGGTATGPSASHVFGASGTYVVTLFVTDNRGATGTGTWTVTVNDPNRVPVARPGGPYLVPAGDPLTFDGSASSDPDGDPLTYLWNFGDNTGGFPGAVVEHTYAAEGTYQASLEVSDGRGGIGGATVTVVVTAANNAPIAAIVPSATFVNPGDEILFDGTGTTDADGDAMALSWTFGDGTGTTGDVVTHAYGAPGHYTVTLTADDQRGRQGTATAAIHVNAPPAFQDPGPRSTAEDAPFMLPLSATDADGHAVTFSLLQGPPGLTVQNGPGSVFWTPANSDVGQHTVRIRAEDGFGGADETQFVLTVTNVNDPPEITSAPILQAVELNPYFYAATVADVDAGDAVTWSLPEAPAGMSVNPVSGQVSWTPAHEQVGNHNVTLVASDAAGAQDVQEFIVSVVELPWTPEFTSTPPAAATEDQPFQYQATARDLNAADVLAFSLVSGPSGMAIDPVSGLLAWTPLNEHVGSRAVRLRVSDGSLTADQEFTLVVANVNDAPSITSGAPGVAVVGEAFAYDVQGVDPDAGDVLTYTLTQGSGDAAIQSATGLISWTPTEAEVGDRSFRVVVQDAAGEFAAQDFVVRVQRTPEPPVFTSAAPTSATQGQPYSYQATATDPNDDPLVFSLVSGPSGMSVTPAGLVSFTPGPSQTGNLPVRLAVTDSRFTVEQAFTLAVANVNDPPVITSMAVTQVSAGQEYQYQVTAVDPDGDPLTYRLVSSPPGMAISPQGLIVWPDAGNRLDGETVAVEVSDGQGGLAVQTFRLAIVLDAVPPIVNLTLSANPVRPGTQVQISITATDNIGIASLALEVDGAPVFLGGSREYFLTPDRMGDLAIVATAVDPNGNVGTASRTLRVSAEADGTRPVVSVSFSPQQPASGQMVTFSVNASDDIGIDASRVWLQVDGQYLDLDPSGRATYQARLAGAIPVLATAYDLSGNYGEDRRTMTVSISGADATPPAAAISGLADHTVVKHRIQIPGTADDANFAYYTLAYRYKSGGAFVEFHRGHSPVVNGSLGTFDAASLENGDYEVRLTVLDRHGNSQSQSVQLSVEGEGKPGVFTLSFTDMTIPLPGIDITIVRTYDSRIKRQQEFGIGWSLDVSQNVRLTKDRPIHTGYQLECRRGLFGTCLEWDLVSSPGQPKKVTIYMPGVRKQEFRVRANTTFAQPNGLVQGTLSFEALPGTFTRLEPLNSASYDLFLGGELLDFSFNRINPTVFRLTALDGTQFILDQDAGGVTGITDPNGNRLDITPSGISHSAGENIVFTRDGQGRVTGISGAGLSASYAYDGHGNLASSTDPNGNVTRYKYAPNHLLDEVINPMGVRAVRTEYDDQGRLTRQTGPDGGAITYQRDLENRTEEITDAQGRASTYTYDADGNVTREVDPDGNVFTYEYDSRGNMTRTVNPDGTARRSTWDASGNELTTIDELGNTFTRTFNALGKPLTITDPMGRTFAYAYDARGNQTRITGPDGVVLRENTYDAQGNLASVRDALGNVTIHAYDSRGNRTSTTDPQGRITRFAYDARGNVASQTDPLGHRTQFTYDANGNLLSETDPLGRVTTHRYNAINRIDTTTGPDGARTVNVYDMFGQLAQLVNPMGEATRQAYNHEGDRVREEDPLGRVTLYAYDHKRRLIRTEFADGGIRRVEYDALGNKTRVVDERGNATAYAYDAAGRNIRMTDALGRVAAYEYDAAGNRTAMVDALGRRTEWTYDAYNRETGVRYHDGSSKSDQYDALGRKVRSVDQLGNETAYAYDAAGNLVSVTDALGNVTRYAYDGNNNRLSITDANSHVTRFAYDALNRLVEKEHPDGSKVTYAYDARGNLIGETGPGGESTAYAYDLANREILRTYSNSGRTVATEYWADGKTKAIVDHRGRTEYEYDVRGQLARVVHPDGKTLAYAYDLGGNKISTLAGGHLTTFAYDPLNRMSSVTRAGRVTRFGYDAVGNRISTSHYNGIATEYQYDALNRLTRATHRKPDGVTKLSEYSYTVNAKGFKTGVTELDGSAVAYAYDRLDRLVAETRTGAGAYAKTFTYDAVGNRLTQADGGVVTNYTHDDRDQLLAETSASGTVSYAYDPSGRLASRTDASGTQTYTWSDDDRLAALSGPSGSVTYEYDALGRKTREAEGGTVRSFLWDETLSNGQVLLEYEGSRDLASYTYGLDRIDQDRGGVSIYLADGTGSIRQLADASGNATDTYGYSAFGAQWERTGTTVNSFGYMGEQSDNRSGFVYLRQRWMDPSTGRFVSEDPVDGCVSCPQSLNRYAYAENSPLSKLDPRGEFTILGISISLNVSSILRTSSGQISMQAGRRVIIKIGCVIIAEAFQGAIMEGVYLLMINGVPYVGQSGNVDKRIAQHAKRYGDQAVKILERFALPAGTNKAAREAFEQLVIDEFKRNHGFEPSRIGARGGSGLWNRVNPVSAARQLTQKFLNMLPGGKMLSGLCP